MAEMILSFHVQVRDMRQPTEGDGEAAVDRDRRRVLAAVGSGAALSLAGCTGVTSQSYESSPVELSDTAQGTLQLAELTRETISDEERVAGGNVSVSITSHTTVYSRAAGLGGE